MSWDAIVLGVGGAGSAALYHLARRGLRVLGLDRFPPGHDRGSSHGATRIIRLAYMEAPDYVPLLRRSFTLWEELEAEAGQPLYRQTGLLQVGPSQGSVLQGIARAAREHALEVEVLDAAQVGARFPGFRLDEGTGAVLDPRAGYLHVERCVEAHVACAQRRGAEVRSGVTVRGWEPSGQGVRVDTDQGAFEAGRLVVTAGAWARELLADLGVPLRVLRKSLFWFDAPAETWGVEAGTPCFLFETPAGVFYGFPRLDAEGVKLAEHSGGQPVADPLQLERAQDPAEVAAAEGFRAAHLAGVRPGVRRHAACMYTMTPDEHFLVDRHPDLSQVVLAAGLSGHGFKMTSALGEALAALACGEAPSCPLEFLGLDRPGLRS